MNRETKRFCLFMVITVVAVGMLVSFAALKVRGGLSLSLTKIDKFERYIAQMPENSAMLPPRSLEDEIKRVEDLAAIVERNEDDFPCPDHLRDELLKEALALRWQRDHD